MFWPAYAQDAALTDEFDTKKRAEHLELLTLGLVGEVGSVLAEVKKKRRDEATYPAYESAVYEELGDCLWYSFRLAQLHKLKIGLNPFAGPAGISNRRDACLALARLAGDIASAEAERRPLDGTMRRFWRGLRDVASVAGSPKKPLSLKQAALKNMDKRADHYPLKKHYPKPFDQSSDFFEQLPRRMMIDFIEISKHANKKAPKTGGRKLVVLRYKGVNIGNKVRDELANPDFYRFHDVFHLAHAAKLGWSPVFRDMMKCKRQGKDEDVFRATFHEESIVATVFERAKDADFYEGARKVDYSLLKRVRAMAQGYEVQDLPAWRWQEAILDGYKVFRKLKANRGGRVRIDLQKRTIEYIGPPKK